MDLNDIPIATTDGGTTSLAAYANQVLLIVNVASKCGLTPQYSALETLHRTYAPRGFSVLGFPSNQFLQELSTNEAIAEFCSSSYGITFPLFDRVRVNGRDAHPLFQKLKLTADAAGKAGRVQWNFEKFLVNADRTAVWRFRPRTVPNDPAIIAAIEAAVSS